jgi:2-methylcitrate dehydratase PrpD
VRSDAQPAANPPAAPQPGLTRHVAAWVAGLRHAQLPEATRQAVRAALLDTLGVGLYGRALPWSRAVAQWAAQGRGVGGSANGGATGWGEAAPSLRAADAALVNGVAAHAYELDDYHNAKLHPGAVVIPAVLALGEAVQADGAALELAIAAGYEVMIRTGLALDPSAARLRGWHLTGVCGPLGAAAGCASLLGLDAEHTAWALGLAGTQGAGLFAFNADGAMSKRFHAGRAAQAGVMAAELAALGFTGPTQIYEAADGGFLAAHSNVLHPRALTDGLGESFLLDVTSFKPYSCCGSIHAHVDAARALPVASPADLAGRRVRAGVARVVDVQCGYDYAPGTEMNAQMSLRYCVAVALLERQALPAQFVPEKLRDPAIVALAQRLEIVHDPALDEIYPAHMVGWVELERTPGGGDFARQYLLDPSGATTNPNREAALREKFHQLLDGVLPTAAAQVLERMVGDLPGTTAGALARAMAVPGAGNGG